MAKFCIFNEHPDFMPNMNPEEIVKFYELACHNVGTELKDADLTYKAEEFRNWYAKMYLNLQPRLDDRSKIEWWKTEVKKYLSLLGEYKPGKNEQEHFQYGLYLILLGINPNQYEQPLFAK